MNLSWPVWDSTFWHEDVDKKTPWRARLRKAQGRYREEVLNLPPGERAVGKRRSRSIVSDLPEFAVRQRPELNFLEDRDIEQVARQRISDREGLINESRLYRNMLASQTLCFNLFVPLRDQPQLLSSILGDLVEPKPRSVTGVRIEWAPQLQRWRSGSAFDAFVTYESDSGERHFVGIECKYAEYLKDQRPTPRTKNPEYWEFTGRPDSGFVPGAAERLNSRSTCQLWYNACLALKLLEENEDYAGGGLLMMSCAEDRAASEAVDEFNKARKEPGDLLRHLAYEQVVTQLESRDELRAWASKFKKRYLSFGDL